MKNDRPVAVAPRRSDDEVRLQAEEYVEEWLPLLHLQDWQTEVSVKPFDIDCCANVRYSMEYQSADIEIRNPDMHPPGTFADPDLEYTVVHELLHLLYCMTPKGDETQNMLHERAIDRTAMLLVDLRRASILAAEGAKEAIRIARRLAKTKAGKTTKKPVRKVPRKPVKR